VPAEFVPVVEAFQRMARDVEASQFALEAARRRTATVLSNVATGVVALDGELRVTIANPSAQRLLDSALEPGIEVGAGTALAWRPVWQWVGWFLRSGDEHAENEFLVETRRIRVQVAALTADPRGCVVALDDTTELAQAVRVLAWGEVARQVAHEIKNPLTPIRLGIQHLQRARRHGRSDFDATLEQTAQQILAEIERLDAIARAFARFGAPPIETAAVERADVAAIAQDAAALYGLGGATDVRVQSDGPVMAHVRKDEVKEVLINLIENARNANAREVEIAVGCGDDDVAFVRVRDNGDGISPDHLPLVFEPHFSTNTSGTGLGLAICRRLVESWGGTIAVESTLDQGTTVTIRFVDRE
jgi:nitrogen fixation/metabolism regulation signal transduction histidine kinase